MVSNNYRLAICALLICLTAQWAELVPGNTTVHTHSEQKLFHLTTLLHTGENENMSHWKNQVHNWLDSLKYKNAH